MVSPVKDAAWVEWITRLIGESPESRTVRRELPASRFYCLLDDQPTHLVPQRLATLSASSITSDLIVNPHCVFCQDGELPSELTAYPDLFANFALVGIIAWVRDPATEAWAPFWLGPEFTALLSGVRPGDPAPAHLPEPVREILVRAAVLVSRDAASERRRHWSEVAVGMRQHFQRMFVPVPGLIHPFHLGALRRYYRYLIRNGRIQLGDDQSPRRYGAHNEPVARFFHHQLLATVSSIVGEPIKPSYVYLCSYLGGSDLEKHTDREQCEFTITCCLDFSPETARYTPWPLHVDTQEGKLTLYQALGDGFLFRGRELPHYRNPLAQGRTSTSIFFHYVRQEFTGSLR